MDEDDADDKAVDVGLNGMAAEQVGLVEDDGDDKDVDVGLNGVAAVNGHASLTVPPGVVRSSCCGTAKDGCA